MKAKIMGRTIELDIDERVKGQVGAGHIGDTAEREKPLPVARPVPSPPRDGSVAYLTREIKPVFRARIIDLCKSGRTQSDVSREFGIRQSTISRWMVQAGCAPGRGVGAPRRIGNEHGGWKGDAASYDAFHKRVVTIRGKPSLCEHCGSTTAKKYEWASKTKKYADVNDYIRLCCSCHRRYDGHGKGEKNGKWQGGPPERRCIQCGASFKRHQNKKQTPKFCSSRCFGASLSQQRGEYQENFPIKA